MKFVLGIFIACVALFFATPIICGGSPDICQDVPVPMVSSAAPTAGVGNSLQMYHVIQSAGATATGGSAERDRETRLHPHIPPVISCTADFWASL